MSMLYRVLTKKMLLVLLASLPPLGLIHCNDEKNEMPSMVAPPGRSTDPLTATITAGATQGRAPLEVAFTSTASGGEGPYLYTWDFGDGNGSTLQNPTFRYTAGGVYTVSLKVTSKDQSVISNAIAIRVDSDLRLSCFVEPTRGITAHTVTYRAEPLGGTGDYSFLWTFGDGGTSTLRESKYTYQSEGAYTARALVTSGAVQASCTETVYVYTSLIASCSAKPHGTLPLTMRLKANTYFCYDFCNYSWDFGDGTSQSGLGARDPTHTYPAAGTYTAKVTVQTGRIKNSCSTTFKVE